MVVSVDVSVSWEVFCAMSSVEVEVDFPVRKFYNVRRRFAEFDTFYTSGKAQRINWFHMHVNLNKKFA